MLKPTGFWSYSSSDDEAANGRLSQLRALLSKELQLKVGRTQKVHIFQDVEAIPPGELWEKRIREALDVSSFVIPIVTPAFLQSEYCSSEIKLFRKRQKVLGRDDLIFPIHYINVLDVDGGSLDDCHDREILPFLRSYQWSDFRELRLKNPEAEEVLRKLALLADAIRAALRREVEQALGQLASAKPEGRGEISAKLPPQASFAVAAEPLPSEAAANPGVTAEHALFKDFHQGPKMVRVPPGRFQRGSPDDEIGRSVDESPLHEVSFAAGFAVGIFPVTFSEWAAAQADQGVDHVPNDCGWGGGNQPVIDVSWEDAQQHVKWLSKKSGRHYRLLTEAEWEYVARAGTTAAFWWGAKIASAQANFDGRYPYDNGLKGEYRGRPLPVDKFEPNPWGLYQVHGNIWEWCEDNWVANYHDAPKDGSVRVTLPRPSLLPRAPYRIVRGGSWSALPKDLRSARRFCFPQNYRGDTIGFRVARDL
jgi:formylglycine-generating enzyme required for sulfatase activity